MFNLHSEFHGRMAVIECVIHIKTLASNGPKGTSHYDSMNLLIQTLVKLRKLVLSGSFEEVDEIGFI